MKKHGKSAPAIGIIPARYEATRFPGKLLALLEGKTVLEHVYRQAAVARKLDELLVATDDERIQKAVQSFGGRVILTSSRPQTGTERVAEACRDREADVVVNIQGDEPLIRGEMIDQVVEELFRDHQLAVVTLARKIESFPELNNPNIVKVVISSKGFALYFSRAPIPFNCGRSDMKAFKHIGIYGYRKEFLSQFVSLPRGELEKQEGLEQLRILENGYKIKVLETKWDTIGIDTPEALERARQMMKKNWR